MITSSQNNKIKTVRSLQTRGKFRRESGLVLCEGVRLAEEAMRSGWRCEYVLYSGDVSARARLILEAYAQRGDLVEEVPVQLFREFSDTETSQGVLVVAERKILSMPPEPDFLLIPAQMRDPGNLGTLLRTAAAAGLSGVLVPPETADAFAPKVMRAGMGAHFHLPIQVMAWEDIRASICSCVDMRTYLAAAGQGSVYTQTDFTGPVALMVGGEASGAPEDAKTIVHAYVQIPMPGGFESLNAGVAGAILIYEVLRQRGEKKA